MALLIDSSVFIELERRQIPLRRILELAQDAEPLACAALTISELLMGIHLAVPSPQRDFREVFVGEVIESVEILDFDLIAARRYATVLAELRRAGNVISTHDLMIGAAALANGYDVLTHNLRDFERIPSLTVRQPAW